MLRRILVASASVIVLSSGSAMAASTSNVNQDGTTSNVSATVSQSGPTGSASDVQQLNNTNNSSVNVTQLDDGNNPTFPSNASSVLQSATAYSSVSVIQEANGDFLANDRQLSEVRQTLQYDGSNASVYQNAFGQIGGENRSYINQDYGYYNNASVWQAGLDSNAAITQYASTYNGAYITQIGDTAGGEGDGDDNNATIGQYWGTESLAGIYQDGARNNASIQQGVNDWGSLWSVGNSAGTTQVGFDNFATTYQAGSGHEAYTVQLGNANYSSIYQTGTGNYAEVWQTNNGHVSTVSQTGTGGYVYVTQN